MRIFPAHADSARAAQAQPRPTELAPREQAADERIAPARGDRIELSGAGRGQTPTERVAAFADHLAERLAHHAEKHGLDLSAVQANLEQHVGRIQAALADGTLDARGLARAMANVVDLVREDLRAGTDPDRSDVARTRAGAGDVVPGSDPDGMSPTERVEAFADRISERIGRLLAGAEGDVATGLRGALGQFGANVDRLLAGIADGSLTGDDLARAIENTLAYAGEDVQRALALAPGETDRPPAAVARGGDGSAVGPAEQRFDEFTSSVLARLEGLDTSGLDREGLASFEALKQDFASAVARLDGAFFDDASIERHDFRALFGAAFDGLKAELAELFGPDGPEGSDAVRLYHPVTGVEELGASPASRLDERA